jgi:MoaA/NifB/PqqE/SkfB family radical SAM enzyme
MVLAYTKTALGILTGSRAFSGPLQAYISLTSRCNIRCIHCFYYSSLAENVNYHEFRINNQTKDSLPDNALGELRNNDIETSRTRILLDELRLLGVKRIFFTGSGEPFLHKNVLEFMDRAMQNNGNATVNTNGTRLDRETINELIRIRFTELKITTMAGTDRIYQATHPEVAENTFDRITDGLLYLAERKASLGTSYPKVCLVFVVTTQNHAGLIDFAKYAAHVKADRIEIRPVDEINDPGLAKVVPTEIEAELVRKQLPEVNFLLVSKGISHNIDYFQKVFERELDTAELYKKIPCYYGWLNTRIELTGKVYGCCRCFRALGDIHENSFSDIWYGDSYKQFRHDAKKINNSKKPVVGCDCFSCPHHTANIRVYNAFHPIKDKLSLH